MKMREMLDLLQETFPLMDEEFLIKCLVPDQSGGMLNRKAMRILNGADTEKHFNESRRRLTVRIDSNRAEAVERAKKYLGIETDQLLLQEALDTALDTWGIYKGGKA